MTKTSVTNFLYCGDKYLFLRRTDETPVMTEQVNGIGGKLESGEDYVTAAIRETEEETGYKVNEKDITFCGVIKFENKGGDDWVTCFFKIKVDSMEIPVGSDTREGNLFWVHQNDVLVRADKWANDLNYIWEDIVEGGSLFFLTVEVSDNQFKIVKDSSKRLKI